jgi:hypothetical protein
MNKKMNKIIIHNIYKAFIDYYGRKPVQFIYYPGYLNVMLGTNPGYYKRPGKYDGISIDHLFGGYDGIENNDISRIRILEIITDIENEEGEYLQILINLRTGKEVYSWV